MFDSRTGTAAINLPSKAAVASVAAGTLVLTGGFVEIVGHSAFVGEAEIEKSF
jgi:hypothetical protein